MKYIILSFLVVFLIPACTTKQTKTGATEREIEVLVQKIEQNTKDACYGGLTEYHIWRLLYLTSPRCQDKVDEKTRERINDFLYRIRERQREEKWEDEENREFDDREEEPHEEEQ